VLSVLISSPTSQFVICRKGKEKLAQVIDIMLGAPVLSTVKSDMTDRIPICDVKELAIRTKRLSVTRNSLRVIERGKGRKHKEKAVCFSFRVRVSSDTGSLLVSYLTTFTLSPVSHTISYSYYDLWNLS